MEPPSQNPSHLLWSLNRREVYGWIHQAMEKSVRGLPGKATGGGDSNHLRHYQGTEYETRAECHTGKSPRRGSAALDHFLLTMGATPENFSQKILFFTELPAPII